MKDGTMHVCCIHNSTREKEIFPPDSNHLAGPDFPEGFRCIGVNEDEACFPKISQAPL